jgi:uncharacterized membrane protein YgdD (TMEM256/DUF423 family)
MTNKIFILIGTAIGLVSVALGAFGAHAFKASLTANNRLDTYETASKYLIYHALALVLVCILSNQLPNNKMLHYSGWSFVVGSVIFSGALYLICLTGQTAWGAVAPIGGLLLISGWALLGIAVFRS